MRFADIPRRVSKKYWIVRQYDKGDTWRWTFLLGANYQLGDWKGAGFYKLSSPEGKRIMLELDCTKEELNEINRPASLFDLAVDERSHGQCERCRANRATEVHHLRYRPGLDIGDVMHVCHLCHCALEGRAS